MVVEFTIIKLTQTNQIEKMLRELQLTTLKPTRSPVHTSWQPDLSTIEPNPSPTVCVYPIDGCVNWKAAVAAKVERRAALVERLRKGNDN